ncbi:MAG: twin-arginine translocase subunit TatC, partial [Nitrospinaceae bacterium]|nr:twin-arginine translocase subunit TatC [Nitrospinaceae bacterium]NIR55001.1 twin-arginine translocase subunit TatC [Nitrospinaceae bacterium]NIT82241.1 twin-arginine translocase subunit TatC [Nitrospinaceae bacterium]NIX34626.1 twin-arginine translocase subunit TatC [Nitrospinaceae bacterium]NIY15458.1 twin-arginine translocase subunit TatC [Nitrospinaceae bacterium]
LCFYFIKILLLWLERPFPGDFNELTFITPTEPFFTNMKVAFMGSLFISMPLILYHVWFFISPGLKVKEKKITMMFVFFGTLFFVFGGVFCYYFVLPLGLRFLLNYGVEYWKMQVTIGFYFSFIVKMILAFAFAFQTPLIMVLLTKAGAINTIKMRMYRKWAFLGAFALSSVLTPPDIITQVLLGFPLYFLYEFGVIVSAFFEDPKQREEVIRRIQLEREMKKAKKEAASKVTSIKKKIKKSGKTKKDDKAQKKSG